jgi:beta-galactosidase
VLHLAPHWTWPGHEGETLEVRAYTNCAEVELRLNGRSLGRARPAAGKFVNWQVPYAPGRLETIGRDARGAIVAKEIRETAGKPVALRLTAHVKALAADGQDCAVLTASAVGTGRPALSTADVPVEFTLEGPGRLLGTGNGCPWDHDTPRSATRRLFSGLAQAIVGGAERAGVLRVRARSGKLKSAQVELTVSAQAGRGPAWLAAKADGGPSASRAPKDMERILG